MQTVKEFMEWWHETGSPIRPPFKNAVHTTEIAYSLCLFRKGRFQVELYIMRPNSETPMHSHPGISAISLYLTGNMDFSREEGVFSDLSQYQKANKIGYHQLIGQHIESIEGTAHAVRTHKEGGAFLIFEHWHDEDPSSVAVAWEGELVGKQHEQTIKAHNEVE